MRRLLVVLIIALVFVGRYVLSYYRHADTTSAWLFLHITGGALALLIGPWQFWTGLRRRYPRVHRWTGRLFLVGVACGVTGAIGLAITGVEPWAFYVGLMGLATAWLVTTAAAYYTIRRGLVDLHREWMTRAYVLTYAFVFFRAANDYSPLAHVAPVSDRVITLAWACWVVPLGITELILQCGGACA
jgi:uncharacterized membrane protein